MHGLGLASFIVAAAWPSVSGPAAPNGLGAEDAAVVAGVSAYFVLPEIKGAADNATDWFQWLTAARGVPLERVRLMRDGEVTREELLTAVEKARGQVGPNGTLWIVFIGHGAPAKTGDDGLLLGVDAQRTEVSVASRGLPQQMLLDAAKGAHKSTVAIFDACFSGMASDGKTPLVVGSQATVPVRRVDQQGQQGGLVVLSSSDEIAGPLPGGERPAFSYLMLGAARGWGDKDADASVTLDEAFGYARSTLVSVVRDKNQTPTMRGIARGVMLASNATERGPDLSSFVAQRDNTNTLRAAQSQRPRAFSDDERATALERYKQRELHVLPRSGNDEDGWTRARIVRGPYKRPVETSEILDAGRERAPDAAAVVDEIESQAAFAGYAIPGSALAGAVVGVAGGLGVGLFAPGIFGSDDISRFVLTPVVGGAVGSMGVMLVIGLPLAIGAEVAAEDLDRLEAAKADLAKAANAAELEKAGLQ